MAKSETDHLMPLSVAGGIRLQAIEPDNEVDLHQAEMGVDKNLLQMTAVSHLIDQPPVELQGKTSTEQETSKPLKRKRDEALPIDITKDPKRRKFREPGKQCENARIVVGEACAKTISNSHPNPVANHEQIQPASQARDQQLHPVRSHQSAGVRPDKPSRWFPDWWGPRVIEDDIFYPSPGLVTVGDGNGARYPCLLLSSELFHAILQGLWANREANSLQRWCDEEHRKIDARMEAIDILIAEGRAQFSELCSLQRQNISNEDRLALWHASNEVMDKVGENEKKRDQLVEEWNRAQQKFISASDNAIMLQAPVVEQLDVLFGLLGVLPDVHDINEAPRVPVILAEPRPCDDPEVAPHDTATIDMPISPPGLADDLLQELEERAHNVHRMDAEFGQFRDGFDIELRTFIALEKAKRCPKPSTAELEEEFGPVWLSRHQEMTRKKASVDEAYYETERRLLDAQRAAALDYSLDKSNDTSWETYCMPVVDELTASKFGYNISTRRKNRIDAWLDGQAVVPNASVPQSSIPPDDTFNHAVSICSDESVISVAEGWLRHKIDDYDRYVGRVQSIGTPSKAVRPRLAVIQHIPMMDSIFDGDEQVGFNDRPTCASNTITS